MSSFDSEALHRHEREHRLERELDYYKRLVNESGSEAVRAREDQLKALRDSTQTRTMLKLVREVYRLGDFGGAEADVEQAVLGLIVENVMCDHAMFLYGPSGVGGRFRVLCALGGHGRKRIGSEIMLERPPRFCFTVGEGRRDAQSAELCALIGTPYILWGHDPGGGFAMLLGNQQESNASRPFEATDRELIETALSVHLDIRHRKREARRIERALAAMGQVNEAEEDQAPTAEAEIAGIQETEIQVELRKGGRLTGFLIVDRTAGNVPEFVGYVRGSWVSGYRLLRTVRLHTAKTYKDVSRLIHLARFDFDYTPPIVVYAAGAPELRRFSGIWPDDLSLISEQQLAESGGFKET